MTGALIITAELPIAPAGRLPAVLRLRAYLALDWREGASGPAGKVAAAPTMHRGGTEPGRPG